MRILYCTESQILETVEKKLSNLPLINIEINGHKIPMVLDTGASMTVMWQWSSIKKLNNVVKWTAERYMRLSNIKDNNGNYEESKIMFTTFWLLLNTLIIIGLIIGVPWFMISVVRLLKKIESRLERLEKTMSEKSKDNLWGDDC